MQYFYRRRGNVRLASVWALLLATALLSGCVNADPEIDAPFTPRSLNFSSTHFLDDILLNSTELRERRIATTDNTIVSGDAFVNYILDEVEVLVLESGMGVRDALAGAGFYCSQSDEAVVCIDSATLLVEHGWPAVTPEPPTVTSYQVNIVQVVVRFDAANPATGSITVVNESGVYTTIEQRAYSHVSGE